MQQAVQSKSVKPQFAQRVCISVRKVLGQQSNAGGWESCLPVFSSYLTVRSLTKQSGREAAVRDNQIIFQSDWLSQYQEGVELLLSFDSRTEPPRPAATGVLK